jgi:hypothetical protein
MLNLDLECDWPVDGVKSITSNIVHKTPQSYLAEIVSIYRHSEVLDIPFFWRDEKYSKSYQGFIMILVSHIKYAGFKAVHKAIVKNKLATIDESSIALITTEID